MIARAGASVSLSLVIVAAAAVVVHRPERTAPPVAIVPDEPRPEPVASPRPAPRPTPIATPSVPWPEPAPASPKAVAAPAPKPRSIASRIAPKRPEAAFVKVERNESLAEVARRVYGPGADVDALWRVNRDQLPTRESTLRSGMILRTPVL